MGGNAMNLRAVLAALCAAISSTEPAKVANLRWCDLGRKKNRFDCKTSSHWIHWNDLIAKLLPIEYIESNLHSLFFLPRWFLNPSFERWFYTAFDQLCKHKRCIVQILQTTGGEFQCAIFLSCDLLASILSNLPPFRHAGSSSLWCREWCSDGW